MLFDISSISGNIVLDISMVADQGNSENTGLFIFVYLFFIIILFFNFFIFYFYLFLNELRIA